MTAPSIPVFYLACVNKGCHNKCTTANTKQKCSPIRCQFTGGGHLSYTVPRIHPFFLPSTFPPLPPLFHFSSFLFPMSIDGYHLSMFSCNYSHCSFVLLLSVVLCLPCHFPWVLWSSCMTTVKNQGLICLKNELGFIEEKREPNLQVKCYKHSSSVPKTLRTAGPCCSVKADTSTSILFIAFI